MTGYCPQDERLDVLSGQCHGTIDFTLAFEDYILVLIPAAILLLSAPLRIYYISRRSIEIRGLSFLLAAKAVCTTLLWDDCC